MKISKVGNIEITEEEQSVFRLHPKMAIRERIEDEELDFQGELGWAKLRITLLKEEEEELDSDDDEDDMKMTSEDNPEDDQNFEELQEIIEAKSRQYYDPESKTFDYGKNSRVTLPRPCSAENEAGIAMRQKSFKKVVNIFRFENCNKKNEQKPNLSREEMAGPKKPAKENQG